VARHRTAAEAREAREARRERHAGETDLAVVINAAARFLELRSRSVDEVRRHLTKDSYPPDLVEGAITRLLEIGLLDDELFARLWVESRDRSKPRGTSALRRELGLRGIDRETVEAVLDERREAAEAGPEDGDMNSDADTGSADEAAAGRLLAKSRSALLRIVDARARRSRAYAILARNGFDPDVCREVSARVAGLDEGADD
jgi:regulatory protein